MTRQGYVAWIEKYYVVVGVILFFMSYLYFFPELWMITDAYSYSSQAIAFSQGKPHLMQYDFLLERERPVIFPPYNLGTASYYALWIKLCGIRGVFLGSIAASIVTIILSHYSLKRLKYNQLAISLLLISPLLFFSRSIMSGIPSMLVISITIYLFSKPSPTTRTAFWLSFWAILSIWFRETNLILAGGIWFYFVWKHPHYWRQLTAAALLALAIKVGSTWWVYHTWWFASASAGFSVSQIFQHVPLYLWISVILIPGGLYYILTYQGRADKTLTIPAIAFILIYILYTYSAIDYSGWFRGSLLTSRFLLPLLPVLVIMLGEVMDRRTWLHTIVSYIFIPCSILLIPISQAIFHRLYQPHEQAATYIAMKYADAKVLYDQSGYTNIIRYINPLSGNWTQTADISSVQDILTRQSILDAEEPIYAIVSKSTSTDEKSLRAALPMRNLDLLPFTAIDSVRIDDSNQLIVYRLLKN